MSNMPKKPIGSTKAASIGAARGGPASIGRFDGDGEFIELSSSLDACQSGRLDDFFMRAAPILMLRLRPRGRREPRVIVVPRSRNAATARPTVR
jgi:hypothetical protein